MSVSERRLPFDAAVHHIARGLRNADQEEFSTQVIGACRAVKGGDVSHVSSAIAGLTAADVAASISPPIPEAAVLLAEVKKVLYQAAAVQSSFVQGVPDIADTQF